jgi:hypothetical protein
MGSITNRNSNQDEGNRRSTISPAQHRLLDRPTKHGLVALCYQILPAHPPPVVPIAVPPNPARPVGTPLDRPGNGQERGNRSWRHGALG